MNEVNPVSKWREDGIMRDPKQDEIDALQARVKELELAFGKAVGVGLPMPEVIATLQDNMKWMRQGYENQIEALTESAAGFEMAWFTEKNLVARMAQYIRYSDRNPDAACRQCLPHSEILTDGFVCAWHLSDALDKPKGIKL